MGYRKQLLNYKNMPEKSKYNNEGGFSAIMNQKIRETKTSSQLFFS